MHTRMNPRVAGSARHSAVPPFAGAPVLAIAAAMGAVLLATSGRYGYFPDELYFIAAGRSPQWGYADQPPLIPLLAAAMDILSGGSLAGFRLPVTVLTPLAAVLTASITRDLSGGRRAQTVAAATFATSGFLMLGHWMLTYF